MGGNRCHFKPEGGCLAMLRYHAGYSRKRSCKQRTEIEYIAIEQQKGFCAIWNKRSAPKLKIRQHGGKAIGLIISDVIPDYDTTKRAWKNEEKIV